ncbi:MAG: hypothetical protein O2890_13285 [Cyanobacteria bacterium]|nr:hypothetical protein [Cyanobacteriota bacterium]
MLTTVQLPGRLQGTRAQIDSMGATEFSNSTPAKSHGEAQWGCIGT